jgi:hypothetical protein
VSGDGSIRSRRGSAVKHFAAVLLANIASRIQGGFEWDTAELKPRGNATTGMYPRTPLRRGWEVKDG